MAQNITIGPKENIAQNITLGPKENISHNNTKKTGQKENIGQREVTDQRSDRPVSRAVPLTVSIS